MKNRIPFVVVIARSPADLIREGEVLHHCVGRMNYDQRMIREESLIFFIRNAGNPDVPFVTVEYSPKNKKVLQCYGDSDTKPDDSVLTYRKQSLASVRQQTNQKTTTRRSSVRQRKKQ
jgi:hypothetical protein